MEIRLQQWQKNVRPPPQIRSQDGGRIESRRQMKQLLITIAALVLVGCVSNMSIYEAAEKGNIRAVKQRLAAGTDVNAKDTEGKTPLDHALNKPSKIIDFLLKRGGKTGEELKAEGK